MLYRSLPVGLTGGPSPINEPNLPYKDKVSGDDGSAMIQFAARLTPKNFSAPKIDGFSIPPM